MMDQSANPPDANEASTSGVAYSSSSTAEASTSLNPPDAVEASTSGVAHSSSITAEASTSRPSGKIIISV